MNPDNPNFRTQEENSRAEKFSAAIESRDKQIESLKSDLRQAAFIIGMVATEEFCVEWEHYKPIAEDWLKEAAKLKEGK